MKISGHCWRAHRVFRNRFCISDLPAHRRWRYWLNGQKKNRKSSHITGNTFIGTQRKTIPGYIQINPSLQSHCEAITAYVLENNSPEAVTLVCRQKEQDRLDYFRNANTGTGVFQELVVPDGVANFDKTDLKKYLKPGRVNVFVMPSVGSQDFVMAFLRKLREVKGTNKVEVYGMPQWQGFESIDGEYFTSLHVHISSAFWTDHSEEAVRKLENRFYEMTGTLPDEDAFTGYDVTLFAGKMLLRYGLSFPERLQKENLQRPAGPVQIREIHQCAGRQWRRSV
jgi:hypothetical protein